MQFSVLGSLYIYVQLAELAASILNSLSKLVNSVILTAQLIRPVQMVSWNESTDIGRFLGRLQSLLPKANILKQAYNRVTAHHCHD